MEYKTADVDGLRIRYRELPNNSGYISVLSKDIQLDGDNYISSFPVEFKFNGKGKTYVKICRFSSVGLPDEDGNETSLYMDITPEYMTVKEYERMLYEKSVSFRN